MGHKIAYQKEKELDCIKINNFCLLKDTIKSKKQPTE